MGSAYCHILSSSPTALDCRFWKVKSSLHQNTEVEASHFNFSGTFRPGVHIYLLLRQIQEQLGDKIKNVLGRLISLWWPLSPNMWPLSTLFSLRLSLQLKHKSMPFLFFFYQKKKPHKCLSEEGIVNVSFHVLTIYFPPLSSNTGQPSVHSKERVSPAQALFQVRGH